MRNAGLTALKNNETRAAQRKIHVIGGVGGAGRVHACDTNRKLWEQVTSVSKRSAVDIEHDAMGMTQENTTLAEAQSAVEGAVGLQRAREKMHGALDAERHVFVLLLVTNGLTRTRTAAANRCTCSSRCPSSFNRGCPMRYQP